jgi:integrase
MVRPQHPDITYEQVIGIADAVPGQLRAAVLIVAHVALRRGEIAALQRQDIDSAARTIHVVRIFSDGDGPAELAPAWPEQTPRAIPLAIWPDIEAHLATRVKPEPDAWLFTDDSGAPYRPDDIADAFKSAAESIGIAGGSFDDLRTGARHG